MVLPPNWRLWSLAILQGYLLFLVPGESHVQLSEGPVCHKLGQLLLVEVVLLLVPTAVIQHCVAHLLAWNVKGGQ